MGVEKGCVARGGKISFSEGGGINIIFGPKYRPLVITGVFLESIRKVLLWLKMRLKNLVILL
jgi:hypothetical protein